MTERSAYRTLLPFSLAILLPFLASCGGSIQTAKDVEGSYSWNGDAPCTGARIDVEQVTPSRIQVSGFATWCRDELSAELGAINIGELAFITDYAEGVATHTETIGGERYVLTLRFTGRGLVVTEEFPDGAFAVHGVNVTFAGKYGKD